MYERKLEKIIKTSSMTMDPQLAKRAEKAPCKPHPPTNYREFYWVFIYDCCNDGCSNEIRVSEGQLYQATGMCRTCVQLTKIKPYQHLLTSIKARAKYKKLPFTLTYEEFIDIINNSNHECHYCKMPIQWQERGTSLQKYSKAYLLDRKVPEIGYTKENCVACCTDCNMNRGDKFSYEEFLLLSPALKGIMENRSNRV